jgi:hypothetical protein
MSAQSNRVTVGVASFRDAQLLDACVDSILAAEQVDSATVVVARAAGPRDLAKLGERYPNVRFLPAASDASVPQLRGMALRAGEGGVVALTEDHCVVSAQWLSRLLEACGEGAEIVGGAMDNARRRRAIDWGAYFAEYGFFGGRAEEGGSVPMPTQANVAYTASAASEAAEWASQGLWENVAYERFVSQGRTFAFRADAVVYQNKSYTFWSFCADRFSHGREYARRRLVDEGSSRRWLYILVTPLLPALLTARVGRRSSAGRMGAFLRALPFTVAFLTAWAAGEASGYMSGPSE